MILQAKQNCRIIDFRASSEARRLAEAIRAEERISRECRTESDVLAEYEKRYKTIIGELE